MRDAIYRLTSPILDRIPDISHQPTGRQVSIGLAASLVFHLLLLLLAVFFGMVLPEHGLLHFAKPKPKLEEIEITVIPPPPPQEELRIVPDAEPPFIDSRGLAVTEKAPPQALFQSGNDMRAASELPPMGILPLPSQLGRAVPNVVEFEQQQFKLGQDTPPAALESLAKSTPMPPEPAEANPAKEEKAAPAPVEQPGAEKATTLKKVDRENENDVALETKPKTAPLPKPQMRARAEVAMLAPREPQPRPAEKSSQTQAEKTRVEGSISNRGAKSVDAKATPLGRYRENIGRAIRSRWNYYIQAKADLVAVGSVRVDFTIDRNGHVVRIRSDDNTSNAAFAAICEQSVTESELMPPGPELAEALSDGKLDITFTFTLY